MIRVRDTISAAALVVFPLCILAYWVLYPAYGLLEPDAIVRAINGHARVTTIANADHELTPASVELFRRFSLSPTMITINIVVALHLVGGILLGIALLRTRVVPRWAGVVALITPPIHFTTNVTGHLVLDALTWIALAAALGCVARVILWPDADKVATPAPSLTPDTA